MNSEDFKCNTCGDYVGDERANICIGDLSGIYGGVWGLCETCFDKEGGNEALDKSLNPSDKSFGHGKEAGLSSARTPSKALLAAIEYADSFTRVKYNAEADKAVRDFIGQPPPNPWLAKYKNNSKYVQGKSKNPFAQAHIRRGAKGAKYLVAYKT